MVEEDLAVAERERFSGEDDTQASIVALELQREPARRILNDLFAHLAHCAIWF